MGDAVDWDDERWLERSDTLWRRGLRWQQAWWRHHRADLPPGPISTTNHREVASMLPLDVGLGPNLMTKKAQSSAAHAIAVLKRGGRPGLINEDRLRRNALSSQPLCFNLFGHLSESEDALLPWVRSVAPRAEAVVCVELEWALPKKDSLGGSAFDAKVEYATKRGRGVLGIEVKYAENLKDTLQKKAAAKYREATTSSDLWRPGAVDALDQTGMRQFWFNQLLVQRVAADYDEGYGVVVACDADVKAREATEAVARQLQDPSQLGFSSIEEVVAKVSGQARWKKEFGERYVDFSNIQHLLRDDDPRRLT